MEVGTVYNTTKSGKVEVIKYCTSVEVYIRFLNTGFERKATAQAIRNGNVSDPNTKNTYGVGYIGDGSYSSRINGKKNPAHIAWSGMLSRCYNHKDQYFNVYGGRGVSVHEDWHNFQVFAEFYERNHLPGTKLDKDIKQVGNMVYSEHTCMFIPESINNTLVGGISSGVFHLLKSTGNDKYQAIITQLEGKSKNKRFSTYEEAREAYLKAKQEKMEFLVSKYISEGTLSLENARYCLTYIPRYLEKEESNNV